MQLSSQQRNVFIEKYIHFFLLSLCIWARVGYHFNINSIPNDAIKSQKETIRDYRRKK